MGIRVRDSDLNRDSSRYYWDLRLACDLLVMTWDMRLDLRLDLKDLRLDLGLEACTSAHFIHRSKTKRSVNALVNNSEHLLLNSCTVQNHTNSARVSSSTTMDHHHHHLSFIKKLTNATIIQFKIQFKKKKLRCVKKTKNEWWNSFGLE